jgi:hypothetical protein
MLSLNGDGWDMFLTCCNLVFRPGAGVYAAITAIVADTVDCGRIIDHGCVVNIVNIGDVHVVYRTIVEEVSVVPPASFITLPEVAEPVRDPAIETNMRAPITLIEDESLFAPTPITRCPKKSHFGSLDPSTGNPVIIAGVVVVGPVARSPKVTLTWTRGLLIHREGRRSE